MTQSRLPPSPESRRILLDQYENMLACIRCGLCLSVCPTYQETFKEEESPRGRIAMARAAAEGHLGITPDFIAHEETCLLCEACTAICPAGVRMEPIGIAVREMIQQEAPTRVSRLRSFVLRLLFGHLGLLRAAFRLLALYQRSGLRTLVRKLRLLKLLGLYRSERLLPEVRGDFLIPKGQRWRPQGEVQHRVAVFAGCVMSTVLAETDRATVQVLVENGCEVVMVKGQGCCGALHLHTGDVEGARDLARRTIAAFSREEFGAIIVNAAGCGSALKGYPDLLQDDPAYAEQARAFARRVRDITEYLAALPLRPPSVSLDLTVTYQEPCHLAHAQRIRQQPRAVLRAIPGVRVVEMEESTLCCGSAGIYNLTQPEMAESLLRRKVQNILATGADIVLTANPGCFMQIQGGLRDAGSPVRIMHIVDLLAMAYATERDGAQHSERQRETATAV